MSQARVFQNSKCAVTGAPLELPAVHFMCGHSCNLRNLGENEKECPICGPQFRTILDIRRSLRSGAQEQVSPSPSPSPISAAVTNKRKTILSRQRENRSNPQVSIAESLNSENLQQAHEIPGKVSYSRKDLLSRVHIKMLITSLSFAFI